MLRVLFIHGLEGSPKGRKARLFDAHYDALTPSMDTGDFEACVVQQAEAVASFAPDVVVGSSFGGAVAWALLDRALWRGPTLLLASAARKYVPDARLPRGSAVVVVHGSDDDVIPVAESRDLAATGDPRWTRFHEVKDDHALVSITLGGRLLEFVDEAAELGRRT